MLESVFHVSWKEDAVVNTKKGDLLINSFQRLLNDFQRHFFITSFSNFFFKMNERRSRYLCDSTGLFGLIIFFSFFFGFTLRERENGNVVGRLVFVCVRLVPSYMTMHK